MACTPISSAHAALHTALTRVLATHVGSGAVVGAVLLVAHDGEIAFEAATGWEDREAARAMRADSVFRLASVSKPIVSAAALALVERGVLALDAAVTRWLPGFRPALPDGTVPPIRVRHLLTHTTGLSYGFEEPIGNAYERAGVSDGLDAPALTLQENLRRIAQVGLREAPGTRWRYSIATDVLGAVLQEAGAAPLSELVATLVTAPLGMVSTSFHAADANTLVTPYVERDRAPPQRMGEPHAQALGTAQVLFSPARACTLQAYPSGGTGLIGSAHDVLRFLEALRRGGAPILAPASTAMLAQDAVHGIDLALAPPGWGWSHGFAVLRDAAQAGTPLSRGSWHWGGLYGHHWFVDPARRACAVLLTNTAFAGMRGPFVDAVRDAVCAHLSA
jgi:CubicO group peptidase (beta-lactamase class C family)